MMSMTTTTTTTGHGSGAIRLSTTTWLVLAVTILLSCLSTTTSAASSADLLDAADLQKTANESLLWGTYRPQLYHGIRARLPKSLMTGLMWHGLNDYPSHKEIRHTCEQSDGLSSYAFTQHDGRRYASQDLVDGKINVKITTKFIKSERGDEWAVRVEGKPIDPSKVSRTSLIYHFGLEGLGELRLESDADDEGIEGDIVLIGKSADLGQFRIRIIDHPDSARDLRGQHHADFVDTTTKTSFAGAAIPDGDVWRVKDLVNQAIVSKAGTIMQNYVPESPPDPAYLFRLNNIVRPASNVFAFQKVGVGADVSGGGPWGFDVFYEKLDSSLDWDYDTLSRAFAAESASYDRRFASAFDLPEEYSSDEYVRFAQDMTSSMIGGIGYFQGESIVDRSFKQSHDDEEEDDEDEDEDEDDGEDERQITVKPKGPVMVGPTELFTATPSRSFFPRGFYWDEGFHLAIIADWDNDLALDIVKSWFDLVDEDGWVAREQILGAEARSKVPTEFQTQYPSYANPPTLVLALTKYIAKLKARTDANMLESQLGFDGVSAGGSAQGDISDAHLDNPDLAETYLRSIYPALRRHYLWFRRTQKGQLREWNRKPKSRTEAYRWRGRTEEHVLTSGLDDYPRAKPPHSGELHVDLMSWVGFFARTMGEVADYLGEGDDLREYQKHERGVLANLDELHWSEEEKAYCDVTVDEDDESVHVCHKGYVTLFPFFLQHIPSDSPHLKDILDLIRSPDHLWSPYGLRSLSMADPYFGLGENYWKGPIWIQMNWLALKALSDKYTKESGPYQELAIEIYRELRANVVDNVFKEWKRTGYLWEQYDAKNGEGRRSHPFTGWTALVVMIMTERY